MRPLRLPRLLPAMLVLAISGCGGEDSSSSAERGDPPAKPPAGWRTVENTKAGFTLSVPRDWSVRGRRGASVLSSPDEIDVITVAADRSEEGRTLDAAAYARRTVDELPDFEGSLTPTAARVAGSPYRSARLDGLGSVRASPRPDRFTVAVFQRPGRVSYAAVAFRNGRVDPRFDEPRLRRILRSFRAQPPGAD